MYIFFFISGIIAWILFIAFVGLFFYLCWQEKRFGGPVAFRYWDRIYFAWWPCKTDKQGWKWLTWIYEVNAKANGCHFKRVKRDQYRHTRLWFFRRNTGRL